MNSALASLRVFAAPRTRTERCHAELSALRPDVEALLVRRTPGRRDYFAASIDHCHRLAGLLRSEAVPLNGPEPSLLDEFFAELDAIANSGPHESVS